MEDYVLIILGLMMVALGWVMGRVMDPEWRVQRRRQFERKDYGFLHFLSDDERVVLGHLVIDFGGKTKLFMNDGCAVVMGGKISREYNAEAKLENWEKQLIMGNKAGIPFAYIRKGDLVPRTFAPAIGVGWGAQMGELFASFGRLDIAKQVLATPKNNMDNVMLILVIIALLGSCLGAYFAYTAMNQVSAVSVQVGNLTTQLSGAQVYHAAGIVPNPTPTPTGSRIVPGG